MNLRSRLSAAIQRTIVGDALVKLAERSCGIRYPDALVGRRIGPRRGKPRAEVLVIAAHPDDEVLGAGMTLINERTRARRVVVVFTTNGAGGNWRDALLDGGRLCTTRSNEACEALGTIGIPPEDIIFLGFPDGGLHRYLREAARDVAGILEDCAPGVVYTHALEGGHCDHDMTSYLVQALCAKLRYHNMYEWCEYNRNAPLGQPKTEASFAHDPYITSFQVEAPKILGAHENIKNTMLSKYVSQSGVLQLYPFYGERLRRAVPDCLLSRLSYFTGFSKPRLRWLCGSVQRGLAAYPSI